MLHQQSEMCAILWQDTKFNLLQRVVWSQIIVFLPENTALISRFSCFCPGKQESSERESILGSEASPWGSRVCGVFLCWVGGLLWWAVVGAPPSEMAAACREGSVVILVWLFGELSSVSGCSGGGGCARMGGGCCGDTWGGLFQSIFSFGPLNVPPTKRAGTEELSVVQGRMEAVGWGLLRGCWF